MSLAPNLRPPLLAAYGELLHVVERQREAFEPFELEAWEALTRERDEIFLRIQAHEQASKHFNSAQMVELQGLIGKVLEHDLVLETALVRAMAAIRAEMGELQLGSVALNSYSAESSLDAFFIDQSS